MTIRFLLLLVLLAGPALADRVAGSLQVAGQTLKLAGGYASLAPNGFLQVRLLARPVPPDATLSTAVKDGEPWVSVSLWFPSRDKLQPALASRAAVFLYNFPAVDPSGSETAAYDFPPGAHLTGFQVSGPRVRFKLSSRGPLKGRRKSEPPASFELDIDLALHAE